MRAFWLNNGLFLQKESKEDGDILDGFMKLPETVQVGPAEEIGTGPITIFQARHKQSDGSSLPVTGEGVQ